MDVDDKTKMRAVVKKLVKECANCYWKEAAISTMMDLPAPPNNRSIQLFADALVESVIV